MDVGLGFVADVVTLRVPLFRGVMSGVSSLNSGHPSVSVCPRPPICDLILP